MAVFSEKRELSHSIYNSAYFPMDLNLEEYFKAMIDSCAVRGWQYFYIDIRAIFQVWSGSTEILS